MTAISGIIIFIVFNSIGFLLLRKATSVRGKIQSAQNWPTAPGVILSSVVQEDENRNAVGKIAVSFIPVVTYEYTLHDKTYQCERVTFGAPGYDYINATNVVQHYPKGAQVTVYVNPDNPAEGVLSPKTATGIFSMIPGIFFIVLGVIVGLYTIFYR
jgi:hypothetical protein